ncbi:MAG: hypothetical protein V1861_03750 [Candidatus Micrarchaeota archaeon]
MAAASDLLTGASRLYWLALCVLVALNGIGALPFAPENILLSFFGIAVLAFPLSVMALFQKKASGADILTAFVSIFGFIYLAMFLTSLRLLPLSLPDYAVIFLLSAAGLVFGKKRVDISPVPDAFVIGFLFTLVQLYKPDLFKLVFFHLLAVLGMSAMMWFKLKSGPRNRLVIAIILCLALVVLLNIYPYYVAMLSLFYLAIPEIVKSDATDEK